MTTEKNEFTIPMKSKKRALQVLKTTLDINVEISRKALSNAQIAYDNARGLKTLCEIISKG